MAREGQGRPLTTLAARGLSHSFWLYTLWTARDTIRSVGPDGQPNMTAQTFGFLIGAYRPEYMYWGTRELALRWLALRCGPRDSSRRGSGVWGRGCAVA